VCRLHVWLSVLGCIGWWWDRAAGAAGRMQGGVHHVCPRNVAGGIIITIIILCHLSVMSLACLLGVGACGVGG
jgi:hypothetical protein